MKRAFTLIEILISITLIGLITMFVSSTITGIKKSNYIFEKKVKKSLKIEKIHSILHSDLYSATKIDIKSYRKYSVLSIRSKNSLYGIEEPHIVWLVLKDKKTLTRMESAKEILPLPPDTEKSSYIFSDKVAENCNNFYIVLSKKGDSVLVFVDIENEKPIISEIKFL